MIIAGYPLLMRRDRDQNLRWGGQLVLKFLSHSTPGTKRQNARSLPRP